MKVLGLVTEYNPFHNGHKYHLLKSKELTGATHTIAVMSGNFLQRGDTALTNKWLRAEMAVEEGIDLVLELPVLYACSSAEFFAFGSISLLNQLNIVKAICFGSECGDIHILQKIAEVLLKEPAAYKSHLKQFLSEGLSFPTARAKSLQAYYGEGEISEIIQSPNNILGIEYLKAMIKINSSIKPYTIKRVEADYHSHNITGNICSATAIRRFLSDPTNSLEQLEDVIPDKSFQILIRCIKDGYCPVSLSDFEQTILFNLRQSSSQQLQQVIDVGEGLENRIKSAALNANTLDSFFQAVGTKRYTLTRLQRIIIHSLLGIKRKDYIQYNQSGGPQYARVLAFSQKGTEILKSIKQFSKIPIISNISKQFPQRGLAQEMLQMDIYASDIYSLGYPNKKHRIGSSDYTHNPYILS